jgi:ADP-ribosylglycohydrolase
VDEVLSMSAEPELLEALPRYFAEDLNAAAATESVPRIVLFFDTHEAFWGEHLVPTDHTLSAGALARDEWLRTLLTSLDLPRGIVPVVAGRQPPQWSRASRAGIADEHVQTVPIGPLSPSDADWYLEAAGIDDPALRRVLVGYVAEGEEVHPYFLGLCADAALLAAEEGIDLREVPLDEAAPFKTKERELVSRLLLWADPETEAAVVGLAACRAFNAEVFARLGEDLGFPGDRSHFERLTRFTFVTPVGSPSVDPGGEHAVFEIHRLLRRLLRHLVTDTTLRAHHALHAFYGGRPDDFSARVEAIYHLNATDSIAGVEEWIAATDRELGLGRYDRCQALVGLLADLDMPSEARQRCMYRSALTSLGIGAWDAAEAVRAELPEGSPRELALGAEIAFARCRFDESERLTREALELGATELKPSLLIRLTEILLFVGRFEEARKYALQGVVEAMRSKASNDRARWLKLIGEIDLFSGSVDEAKERFDQAVEEIEALPEAERDQSTWAGVLGDLGLVGEVQQDWGAALDAHERALRVREGCCDAKGVAASLHGIGKAQCGAGAHERARASLSRAARAAADLGEPLLLSKIRHARGRSYLDTDDHHAAREMLMSAVDGFRQHGTPFDVSHGLLTLADYHAGAGAHDVAVACRDDARALIEAGGFLLLYELHPDARPPQLENLVSGLRAFAAGDALGVPWEGKRPDEIDLDLVRGIPARGDWPAGSTSDDTAQLMLVAQFLVDSGAEPEVSIFLDRLAAAITTIRGSGPTSTAAVERYLSDGSLVATHGDTNGAAMRALPIGWSIPASNAERRRALTIDLSRTTHGAPGAIVSACVVAAMGAWALEGVPIETVIERGLQEAEEAAQELGLSSEALLSVLAAADGDWKPPREGISLDAITTVAAVVDVLRRGTTLADALENAVSLGGDTDTVAALVGGIWASRGVTDEVERLMWISRVTVPPDDVIVPLAEGMVERRRAELLR